MEGLYSGLHRTAQTLETDATLRLPKRARGNPNSNAFENFGSTLRVAPSSSQAQPKSKHKSQSSVSREPTRPISIKKPISEFLDSEDELDFLSSSQADPDDYQPSNKVSVSQPGKYTDGNGKAHDYDPKFPFKKSNALAKLKFTKTKNLGGDNATIPSFCSFRNQPDSNENSQDFGSWVNDLKKKGADRQAIGECSIDDDVLEISSPPPLKSSNQHLNLPQSTPKQPVDHKLPDASFPARLKLKPLPLPLPRPTCKSNADAGSKPDAIFVDGHELFPLGRAKTTTDTKGKGPYRSPSFSISTPEKKDGPGSQPSSPKNFPMDMISPLGGKVQRKPLPKPNNKVKPPSFEMSHKLSTFPMPSPQSSKRAGTSQPKGKIKARPFPLDESDEDESDKESDCDKGKGKAKAKGRRKRPPSSPKNFPMDAISPLGGKVQKKILPKPRKKVKSPSSKVSRKPRAFPMPSPQSSDTASIRSSLQSKGKNKAQPFPQEGLSKHQKRISEGRSDDERQAKKKRQSSLSYVFMFIFQYRFHGSDLIGSDLVNIVLKTKAIQVRTQAINRTRAHFIHLLFYSSNNLSRHRSTYFVSLL